MYQDELSSAKCKDVYHQENKNRSECHLTSLFLSQYEILMLNDGLVHWTGRWWPGTLSTKNIEKENSNNNSVYDFKKRHKV